MKKFPIIALAFVMLALSSCFTKVIRGSGRFVDETRTTIGSFTGMKLASSFDVTIVKDSVQFVELRGEDNILPEVATDVINGQLVLKMKRENVRWDFATVRVTIHTPAMNDIEISGSGNVTTNDEITSVETNLIISGSGNITHRLAATKVDARVSGSGNITTIGSCGDLEILISGSGKADMRDMATLRAYAEISGSGNTWVDVSEWLDVNISGSGDVMYRKKAASPLRNIKISGSGRVLEF